MTIVGAARLLRYPVGIILLVVATMFLFLTDTAHVRLCMIAAIIYSLGLLIPNPQLSSKIASIGFSGILFYTVYTGTTYLLLERIGDGGLIYSTLVRLDEAWLYHTAINFVLLLLFFAHLDDMTVIIKAFGGWLLIAPLLLVIGRPWPVETPLMIGLYTIVGALISFGLLLPHRPKRYQQLLRLLKKGITVSLWLFMLVTLLPLVS